MRLKYDHITVHPGWGLLKGKEFLIKNYSPKLIPPHDLGRVFRYPDSDPVRWFFKPQADSTFGVIANMTVEQLTDLVNFMKSL